MQRRVISIRKVETEIHLLQEEETSISNPAPQRTGWIKNWLLPPIISGVLLKALERFFGS